MKVIDANSEVLAIKAICDSPARNKVLSRVNLDFFGTDQAKEVYTRVTTLIAANKPVPSSDVLRVDEALSEVSRAFVSSPVKVLTEDADLEAVFGLLDKFRRARILATTLGTAFEVLRGEDPDLDSVVEGIELALQKCHSGLQKSEMMHYSKERIDEVMKIVSDELDEPDHGKVPSGFGEYDKHAGGFRKKGVQIMASSPGGGKTAMALQAAANQYLMGYNVCFISWEMDEIEIRYRLLSSISKIDHSDINLKRLTRRQKDHINKKFREFLEMSPTANRLTIWRPQRELNLPEIASEIKPYGYDIVYIDYIGLLKMDPKKQLWEMLGIHSRAAKLAAGAIDAAFVLLAQMDDETNKVKYAKAIVANADGVWVWENNAKEVEAGIIEVQQPKSRGHKPFPFLLARDMSIMTFRDYYGPPPQDIKNDAKQPQPPKMKGL